MASRKETQGRPSSPDLLATLNQVYARQRIQRDVFGRRLALPSEIARVLEMGATSVRQVDHGKEAAPTSPFNPAEG